MIKVSFVKTNFPLIFAFINCQNYPKHEVEKIRSVIQKVPGNNLTKSKDNSKNLRAILT